MVRLFIMSGSVTHSIEAQRYTQERLSSSSTASSEQSENESSSGSAISSRSSSDYTVNLSEEAQQLLNDEQNASTEEIDEGDPESSNPKDGQTSSTDLSEDEQSEVDQLEARDAEVRTHEQAHASAGGQYAGSPSYSYEQGPDGKRYITDGEVQIDVSPISGNPQATIDKMQQVYRAALAPAEPSAADRAVAREAQAAIAEATAEIARSVTDNTEDEKTTTNSIMRQPPSVLESQGNQASQQRINLFA